LTKRILILALAMGLTACSAVRAHLAFWRHAPRTTAVAVATPPPTMPAPKPADGLWAILDPGCPKPNLINFKAWPKCAQPFWISRETAVMVRSLPGRGGTSPDQSYRADYRLAAGDPVIAQVGNAKDGFLYLALTELARDDQGRLIAATGAAFACPKPADGAIRLRPNLNGCESESPEAMRKVASETLADHAALMRVAWIAPGAP
jgi:hypothetical protein